MQFIFPTKWLKSFCTCFFHKYLKSIPTKLATTLYMFTFKKIIKSLDNHWHILIVFTYRSTKMVPYNISHLGCWYTSWSLLRWWLTTMKYFWQIWGWWSTVLWNPSVIASHIMHVWKYYAETSESVRTQLGKIEFSQKTLLTSAETWGHLTSIPMLNNRCTYPQRWLK